MYVPSPIDQSYVSASPFSSVAEPFNSTDSPSTDAYGPPTWTTGGTLTGSGAQLFASRYPPAIGVYVIAQPCSASTAEPPAVFTLFAPAAMPALELETIICISR